MPPRFGLTPLSGRGGAFAKAITRPGANICLFCSLSFGAPIQSRKPKRRTNVTRRLNSNATAASTPNPRAELETALKELQQQAANFVNLSRVQLALAGLRQEPGNESIRIAVLGLANGTESGRTAKEVLRLILADPLTPEQDWEEELRDYDAAQPLIIRVGQEKREEEGRVAFTKGGLLREITVSSPSLNGNNLEILVTETNPLVDGAGEGAFQDFEEAALVPTVDIPTSSTGRYTPITTPVHKALLVTDGIIGAASAVAMPLVEYKNTIAAAVNLPGYTPDDTSGYTFATIDLKAAAEGLDLFRESLGNAFNYERLWFQSNVPVVLQWLKAGAISNAEGVTKEPVRALVASILRNARMEIQEEESRLLSSVLSERVSGPTIASLNKGLADWAQSAHEELQEQLDLAFTSRRWRKLGWWKLFWRVDDVGLLSSELLSQRFLPNAERSIIYFAGRINGAGLVGSSNLPVYSVPVLISQDKTLPSPDAGDSVSKSTSSTPRVSQWPTHIPFMRNYLLTETVPALQALAQKLTVQSLSASALASSLAGLIYLSSFGAYEAGAVAALGIVWTLRRMQRKWETAREFWEGEVREEGRKAVRAVEASVAEALDKASHGNTNAAVNQDDVRKARELVQKAQDALERLR